MNTLNAQIYMPLDILIQHFFNKKVLTKMAFDFYVQENEEIFMLHMVK